jgi:uncharacterized protein YjiS (DUF1127 family)
MFNPLRTMLQRRARRRMAEGLLQRDDHLLDDIGITRDDLMLMLAGRSTTFISLGRARE